MKPIFTLPLRRVPRYLRTPFLISILISFSLALIVLSVYFIMQPVIPFFYSLAEPNDFLAPKAWLFFFPIFSFFITFFHFTIVRALRHYEHVIQQLFVWFTIVIQILLAAALLRIIFIVI